MSRGVQATELRGCDNAALTLRPDPDNTGVGRRTESLLKHPYVDAFLFFCLTGRYCNEIDVTFIGLSVFNDAHPACGCTG